MTVTGFKSTFALEPVSTLLTPQSPNKPNLKAGQRNIIMSFADFSYIGSS